MFRTLLRSILIGVVLWKRSWRLSEVIGFYCMEKAKRFTCYKILFFIASFLIDRCIMVSMEQKIPIVQTRILRAPRVGDDNDKNIARTTKYFMNSCPIHVGSV